MTRRRRQRSRRSDAPGADAPGAETDAIDASDASEGRQKGDTSDGDTPRSDASKGVPKKGGAPKAGAPKAGAPKDGKKAGAAKAPREGRRRKKSAANPVYAAIDLGTNNCRLLIASPRGKGYRVVDAFSRIVRLGEGLSSNGALSDAAMARTVDALKVCSQKMARRSVRRHRFIATQACRAAENGDDFLARVREETGIDFEVITPQEEARLAVNGCADLLDPAAKGAVIFDIGGGSTEVSFVRLSPGKNGAAPSHVIEAWFSMPIGVVNLSERWGGRQISDETYDAMAQDICAQIDAIDTPPDFKDLFANGEGHFLGTSGTVTSLAGVHLGLERYRRDAVDGVWLSAEEARSVSDRLRSMSFEERAAEPCIGPERADLVVCGCAILEALLRQWPAQRIRVADRGLREGLLAGMMSEDRQRAARQRRRARKRRRGKGKGNGKGAAEGAGDAAQ